MPASAASGAKVDASGPAAQEEVDPDDDRHDEEAAHRRRAFLDVVALRSVLADPLRETQRVEQPDVGRHQDDHQGEREQQSLDQLDGHRAGTPAEVATQAVDHAVEADPARRLDQHDVAVAQAGRQHVEGGFGVADANDAVRIHPGRDGALGDRRRIGPDHHEPVDGPCRGLADDAMALVARLAQLEHLAEHGAAAAGQPGQQVERGDHGPRRGVVAVVDDRHATKTNELDPMRCRPARGQALGDLVDAEPGGPTDCGPGQRVMDRQPAEGRDRDRSAARIGAQGEAHPGGPGRLDGLGTDVGVGREPVADAPGRRAGAHAPDDLIVGIEDRGAVGGECLEQLALGRLDRLDRPDPRQVDRLDGRHHADLRPGEAGQVGDLAARVHPHLEDGGLVLRAEAHQRQGQADLVVLVALVAQRPEAAARGRPPRPPWSTSWRCSRSRRRPAARTGDASHRRWHPVR